MQVSGLLRSTVGKAGGGLESLGGLKLCLSWTPHKRLVEERNPRSVVIKHQVQDDDDDDDDVIGSADALVIREREWGGGVIRCC